MYCNDEWGTVCDDTFSSIEAIIACKQLGYNDYHQYGHLTQYVNYNSTNLYPNRILDLIDALI